MTCPSMLLLLAAQKTSSRIQEECRSNLQSVHFFDLAKRELISIFSRWGDDHSTFHLHHRFHHLIHWLFRRYFALNTREYSVRWYRSEFVPLVASQPREIDCHPSAQHNENSKTNRIVVKSTTRSCCYNTSSSKLYSTRCTKSAFHIRTKQKEPLFVASLDSMIANPQEEACQIF